MFTWVFQELNFKYIFKLWVYKQTREPPADAAARLVYSEVLTPPIFLWWWRQAGWREGSSKATWRTPGDLRRKRHQRTRASLQTWRSADIISQGKQTYKYYNHKSWNRLFQLLYWTFLYASLYHTTFLSSNIFGPFFPHLPKPALLYIQFQSNKTFRALCHITCIFLHDDLLSFI